MTNISENKIKLSKKLITNIVIFLLLSYFIFHSIYGSRGIIAYFKFQAEIERSYDELDKLKAQRLEVENRTKLLRPNSIDKDMLDEKVRSVLGGSKKEEKIFSVKP